MAAVSLDRIRDRLRAAFWLIPSACALAAVGLAIGLVALDRGVGDDGTRYLFPGPPEGARSFLGAIIGAMISFTGLVFSITVVVLVLTSGQFSPRVLRRFLRDRTIQWTLGVFVATFLFAMTVLRTVLGTDDNDAFVPRLAVTVAFGLVLLSVGLFIRYIHHIITTIQVANIITDIGRETRDVLEARYPPDPAPELPAPPLASATVEVPAPHPGVLTSVAERRIAERACREGMIVAVVPRIGDFVPGGAPLCLVHGDGPTGWILDCLALDDERTMEQDVAFGFRQLVDIAERALSPSTNDPTTACQAIDALHDLLRRIVSRPLPSGRYAGTQEDVGLIVPQYSGADYVDVAIEEIWQYGADSTQVPDRLAMLLRDLRTVARPEHLPAVERWCTRILTRASG